MGSLWLTIKNLLAEEDGVTAVEYAIGTAFVVLVCIVSIQLMRDSAANNFTGYASNIGQNAIE